MSNVNPDDTPVYYHAEAEIKPAVPQTKNVVPENQTATNELLYSIIGALLVIGSLAFTRMSTNSENLVISFYVLGVISLGLGLSFKGLLLQREYIQVQKRITQYVQDTYDSSFDLHFPVVKPGDKKALLMCFILTMILGGGQFLVGSYSIIMYIFALAGLT